mmetsp:Transcript_73700/g.207657  ORF Transcript_73700/g.207657 Transcript_73700/m.207657 type:complete len:90 (+) Transcript_73700:606-875(+)
MAISLDGRFVVANFYPAIDDAPPYLYARCVKTPHKNQPPWLPREPGPPKVSPLSEANWDAHEELETNMRIAANLRPELEDIDFGEEEAS